MYKRQLLYAIYVGRSVKGGFWRWWGKATLKRLFEFLESDATAEEKQVQAWFKVESGKAAKAKAPVGELGQVLEVWQGVQQLWLECQDRLEPLERLERGAGM